MNEREWLRIAGQALQTLNRIEESISKPKDISSWRVAANRRISKAMDYIAEATIETNNIIESTPGDTPIGMVNFIPIKKMLDDIREILTSRD